MGVSPSKVEMAEKGAFDSDEDEDDEDEEGEENDDDDTIDPSANPSTEFLIIKKIE